MFLVASTQLYKRVCLSIRPLVRRSVMLSLGGQRLDSEQRMVVYTNLFMTFLHFSRGLGSVPESLSIRNLVTTLACVSVCLSIKAPGTEGDSRFPKAFRKPPVGKLWCNLYRH